MNIEFDAEVVCAVCGKDVTGKALLLRGNRVQLEIDPCDTCLQSAHDDGVKEAEE